MELLAIKSEKGKGVYICENKKEKSAILNQYVGCSNRTFKENEKAQALEWAGVKEISNRPQQVVDVPQTKVSVKGHTFIETLKELRKRGYAYATIYRVDGKCFSLFLDDFKRLITSYAPSSFGVRAGRNDEPEFVVDYSSYSNYGSMTFERFKEIFENRYKDYSSKMDYESCLYQVLKKAPYTLYQQIRKPSITMIGDFAIVESIFDNLTDGIEGKNLVKDYTFNTNLIVRIAPHKLEREITDERYLRVIKKLEKDGTILHKQ